MSHARLVTFEDSGHAPFWDEADRFNAELDGFIQGLPKVPLHGDGSKEPGA